MIGAVCRSGRTLCSGFFAGFLRSAGFLRLAGFFFPASFLCFALFFCPAGFFFSAGLGFLDGLLLTPAGQKDADPCRQQTEEAGYAGDEQQPVRETVDQPGDGSDLGKDAESTDQADERQKQVQDPDRVVEYLDLNGSLQCQDTEDQ